MMFWLGCALVSIPFCVTFAAIAAEVGWKDATIGTLSAVTVLGSLVAGLAIVAQAAP